MFAYCKYYLSYIVDSEKNWLTDWLTDYMEQSPFEKLIATQLVNKYPRLLWNLEV
jgi:hypothetical protein